MLLHCFFNNCRGLFKHFNQHYLHFHLFRSVFTSPSPLPRAAIVQFVHGSSRQTASKRSKHVFQPIREQGRETPPVLGSSHLINPKEKLLLLAALALGSPNITMLSLRTCLTYGQRIDLLDVNWILYRNNFSVAYLIRRKALSCGANPSRPFLASA